MTTVREITKYTYNGKEYKSLLDIKSEVENSLGLILDTFSNTMRVPLSTQQKLDIFAGIVSNKEAIKVLLSIELEKEINWQHTEVINILDI